MAEEIIEQATAAPGERRVTPSRLDQSHRAVAARLLLEACNGNLEQATDALRAAVR